MNVEWAHLRVSAAAEAAVVRWRSCEAVFADVVDLGDVLTAAERRGDNDPALAALLRQAQAGDEFAARTVLQVMLGATVNLARRTCRLTHNDLNEAISRAVATLWGLILSYPIDRRTGHVANLSLDILGALTRRGAAQRELQQTESLDTLLDSQGWEDGYLEEIRSHLPLPNDETLTPPSLLSSPSTIRGTDEARADFWDAVAIDAHRRADDELLLLLLGWGSRTGAISQRDAQMLLALHSPTAPGRAPTAADVARDLGMTPANVRQRSSRAIRQLRAAVQAYAAEPAVGTPAERFDDAGVSPRVGQAGVLAA